MHYMYEHNMEHSQCSQTHFLQIGGTGINQVMREHAASAAILQGQ